MELKILQIDPYLAPHKSDLELRMQRYEETRRRLLGEKGTLTDFANGHLYYGFHRDWGGWVYREWAPAADAVHVIGEFNGWNRESHPLHSIGQGNWEIRLSGKTALKHGSRVKIQVTGGGKTFDRLPLYCHSVVQDPKTKDFDGLVWCPSRPFPWTDQEFQTADCAPLLIYECHVGMAGEEEKVSTFKEFIRTVLPRVERLGYNAIQLMAVMEHPYYGSFGYQVSNFFAVSSRFGTPDDLKELVDAAHSRGIAVLLDLVHSHAARNALEGIAQFDGTETQFFREGPQGDHPAWGTKLFNYGKDEVLHFLLSNIKYWLEEYHLDGYRFDGVTSMLYHDHGLGGTFDHYNKYFSLNTDLEAITYLQLAAQLSKEVNPHSILIAEDMSGMPGMCLPVEWGGIGFDYRLGMGTPDFWIRTLKEKKDEDWNMGQLWHELNQRRPREKVVGYCESHDQALVGDKTLMFWLADSEMYWHMSRGTRNLTVDRAIALHKMIRLITCTCAGEGYLNFMGNEFGHPEWIDFPREGNGWSYQYARRQWSLCDNDELLYSSLEAFDQAMIMLVRNNNLLASPSRLTVHHEDDKLLAYFKDEHLFVFNFHPTKDHTVTIPVSHAKCYETILHTSWPEFGGYKPREFQYFNVQTDGEFPSITLRIDMRSALVCRAIGLK